MEVKRFGCDEGADRDDEGDVEGRPLSGVPGQGPVPRCDQQGAAGGTGGTVAVRIQTNQASAAGLVAPPSASYSRSEGRLDRAGRSHILPATGRTHGGGMRKEGEEDGRR